MKASIRYTILTAAALIAGATSSLHAGTIESLASPFEIGDDSTHPPAPSRPLLPADFLDPKRSLLNDPQLKDGLLPLGPPPVRAHADIPDFPEARSKRPKVITDRSAHRIELYDLGLGQPSVFNHGTHIFEDAEFIDEPGIPGHDFWLTHPDGGRVSSPELTDRIAAKPSKFDTVGLVGINAIPAPGSGFVALLGAGLLSSRRRR